MLFDAQMSLEPQGSSRPVVATAFGAGPGIGAAGCVCVREAGFGAERLKTEESKFGVEKFEAWTGGGFLGTRAGAGVGAGESKSKRSAVRPLFWDAGFGAGGFGAMGEAAEVKSPKPLEELRPRCGREG